MAFYTMERRRPYPRWYDPHAGLGQLRGVSWRNVCAGGATATQIGLMIATAIASGTTEDKKEAEKLQRALGAGAAGAGIVRDLCRSHGEEEPEEPLPVPVQPQYEEPKGIDTKTILLIGAGVAAVGVLAYVMKSKKG